MAAASFCSAQRQKITSQNNILILCSVSSLRSGVADSGKKLLIAIPKHRDARDDKSVNSDAQSSKKRFNF
jgi:hypothetical protein